MVAGQRGVDAGGAGDPAQGGGVVAVGGELLAGGLCLALATVVSAVSSLNVALPDLARDTGATTTELQWIVDAYALVFAGLLLPAGAIGDLVWAFIEGPQRGWGDALVVGGFVAAVVLLAGFVVWELRRREPMLDPRLFALGGFSAGTVSVFVPFFAAFGMIFVLLQYLQLILGYSPLQAGAALAPVALVMVAVAPRVPKLVERIGVRPVAPTGLVLMAVGFVLLSTMDAGSSYWHLLISGLVFGLGMALATAPATTAIVGSLPDAKQGVASAVNDAAREVGAGVLLAGAVFVALRVPGLQTAPRISASTIDRPGGAPVSGCAKPSS